MILRRDMKSGNNIMPMLRKYLLLFLASYEKLLIIITGKIVASYENLLIIITGKIVAECLFNIHAYKQTYIILDS